MARAPRRAVATVLLCLTALLCTTALLAGCTVGPSQRPPVAVRGDNMPVGASPTTPTAPPDQLPVPQPQNASIRFDDCTEDALTRLGSAPAADRTLRVECGEIDVPVDPDQPGLGGVALTVVRAGAADAPSDRPPLLVLGDSGGEPSALAAVTMAARVDPAVLTRYTLVGLDRRGAGADLLDCAPDEARAALVEADGIGEADLAVLLEQARAVVQECTLALDGGLGRYRSELTAQDVELLRAALGVERLSAIGVGDGAGALGRWAGTAPAAVGTLVLDGPPHPLLDEPELSESRAAAAEAAFGAFGVACTARAGCPLGADPRAAVTGLVDRLRTQPLTAVDGRRLTAGATASTLLDGLRDPTGWPALAAALAAGGTGDPAPLLDLLEPLTGSSGRFDAMLATTCNDTRRRLAPGEVGELAQRWRAAYPLFGGTLALRLLACAPWPTGAPPVPVSHAEGAPPILVIGTAADPRGALEGSRRTAEGLASARFLSWQGAGSGAYPRTPCVAGVVDAMLLDGAVPDAGTLCPP